MQEYASVSSRFVALIIDTLILFFAFIILMAIFMLTGIGFMSSLQNIIGLYIVVICIFFGYFTYFEGSSGQTIGKKALDIKIVKENNNQKITYTDAFIRTLLRLIDGIFFYIVGLVIVCTSKKKQRLGDMAIHTIVVKV